jgi:ATP-dependent RNA helicase SUPV3L1/SUV3
VDVPSSHLIKWGGGTFIRALLGPTNTGKTYRAIARMLEYKSGMMGFPLRLLAREVYDRVCTEVGTENVALITGEERIKPKKARYWICTVESMPVSIPVSFLVVDEIQLAVHPKRGHIFTDRLLHARGMQETWFLGSDMMIPVFERLLPTIEIERMERLSKLRCVAPKRLEQIPKRSAVVAFSASELYSMADALRRLRGGVAVVFGALSPSARNAQVQMFEQGEVDYLVSTDAIGMGLNLNIRSLFFDSLRKFDGREHRKLQAWEIGQIAGRAGRYKVDGAFGLTAEAAAEGEWSDSLVRSIEEQSFFPVYKVRYRNSDLDLQSIESLKDSLQEKPFSAALIPALMMNDEQALHSLSGLADVHDLAGSDVELLWDVCRIPDYHQGRSDRHHRFLGTVFRQLRSGTLNDSWVHRSISRLEGKEGEIDTLMERIAHTRTWAYISYRHGWLDDGKGVQQRLRLAEESLSQALHTKLSERFIDYRSQPNRSFATPKNPRVYGTTLLCDQGLMGTLRDGSFLLSGLCNRMFGWKQGMALGRKYFSPHVVDWGRRGITQTNFAIEGLDVVFEGVRVLSIRKGRLFREPKYKPAAMELLDGALRTELVNLAISWYKVQIQNVFLSDLPPTLRGLEHLINSYVGVAPRSELPKEQKFSIKKAQRFRILKTKSYFVYKEALRPKHQRVRLALLMAWFECSDQIEIPAQRVSFPCSWPVEIAAGLGWPIIGSRAIRIDILTKIDAFLTSTPKRVAVPNHPTQWLGCSVEEWHVLLKKLGYRIHNGLLLSPKERRR